MPLLVPADFETHLYEEYVNEISRSNNDVTTKAINAAEAEVKAYLNRYDLAAMFTANNTDQLLRSKVLDVALWHLIKLANPNINYEVTRDSYKDAISFFTKVMKGEIDPVWPLRPDNPDTPIDDAGQVEFNSNTKRQNHF